MNSSLSLQTRIFWVIVFAAAFGFVESAVVVYLRALYHPEGFTLPLKVTSLPYLTVEIFREMATIIVLIAVGVMAGVQRWERFGYFLVAFGAWDVFFYIWLKALIDWPASLLDWDILFLIPVPWLGPVVAPVIIASLMVGAGVVMLIRLGRGRVPHLSLWSCVLGGGGGLVVLVSFIADTGATLRGQIPQPYRYELLATGVLLLTAACAAACGLFNRRSG